MSIWKSAAGALALCMMLGASAPALSSEQQQKTEAEEMREQSRPLTAEERKEAVEAGGKLAEERCASCHAIGPTGASPNKEAPPFRDFASKWPVETLEEALAEGIVTGHEEMPEFVFSPDEIAAFLEFLASLEKK